MKAVARASIDLQGKDLRYAEVEHLGGRYRLLRLGSCDFDFDVVREIVQEPESGRLISVREALRDVLSGSVASHLRFVLHAPAIRTFFSAVPSDLPRSSLDVKAHQEAALLYGVGPALSVEHEIAVDSEPENGREAWQCVSVILSDVRKKLSRLAAALPGATMEALSSRAAAGHAVRRFQRLQEGGDGVVLAVGIYDRRIEICFGRGGQWIYSHALQDAVEPDAAYFSAEVLSRIGAGVGDVTHLLTFGVDAQPDVSTFARLYDVQPTVFDPLMLVNLDPATVDDEFVGGAYLPCIGGAL